MQKRYEYICLLNKTTSPGFTQAWELVRPGYSVPPRLQSAAGFRCGTFRVFPSHGLAAMAARDMAHDRKPQSQLPNRRPALSGKRSKTASRRCSGMPEPSSPTSSSAVSPSRHSRTVDASSPMDRRVVEEISDHVAQVIGTPANRNRFVGRFDFDRPSGFLDDRQYRRRRLAYATRCSPVGDPCS